MTKITLNATEGIAMIPLHCLGRKGGRNDMNQRLTNTTAEVGCRPVKNVVRTPYFKPFKQIMFYHETEKEWVWEDCFYTTPFGEPDLFLI